MNRKVRIALIVLLSLILVFSVGQLVIIQMEYQKADKLYAESRSAHFSVSEETPPLAQTQDGEIAPEPEEYFPRAYVDLEGLREVNPQVVGWIWAPGTTVNFPLVQGEDNAKYLSRSYDLDWSNSGSIFLDYRNSPGLTDENSAIYGHNMKNGGMFGRLKDYAEKDYLEEHELLYVFLADRTLKYRIFAAYRTESTSEAYTRDFSGELSYTDYLELLSASAQGNVNEPPTEPSPLLLLSTCTSDRRTERFVVHAVLVAEKAAEGPA